MAHSAANSGISSRSADTGVSIPSQAAIEKRREQLGVGAAPNVPVEDVQTILKEIGLDKIIAKEE